MDIQNQPNEPKRNKSIYVRNIIFGVEDSLVSTVGLLSGVAASGLSRNIILLTGVVLIFVEAFSMGVGSLLSEHSVEEYEQQGDVPLKKPLGGAVAMLISYLIAGLIPLLPYVFMETPVAIFFSIALSLLSLFMLGALSAAYFRARVLRLGVEMLVLGGVAIGLGVMIGKIFDVNI
jgi:VIT1/CCC1 family predicted Fe2+/Mn2+ transporter